MTKPSSIRIPQRRVFFFAKNTFTLYTPPPHVEGSVIESAAAEWHRDHH